MVLDVIRYLWAAPNTLVGLLGVPLVVFERGRMRVVEGVMEIHGPVIAWLLRRCVLVEGGVCAITFGHIVLARDQESLDATRAHERVHVRQYERWGPLFIPAYLLASLWGLFREAGIYYGNFFERQAMEADRTVLLSANASDQRPR
jgi:hypothetical protein